MFNFFGSKSRLVEKYPTPTGGIIVEPFAGSARYAVHYCRTHEVWINDLDPLIYNMWMYIKNASRKDIQSLPELSAGESLNEYKSLSSVEKALIGFCLAYSQSSPRQTCTEWAERKQSCKVLKQRILDNLEYVKHWTITNLHYDDIPNDGNATWFVDPPYQYAKSRYRYHCIADYDRLAQWCQSRQGQVIVCEGDGADWLPFKNFAQHVTGTGRLYQELIWEGTDLPTAA